MTKIKQSKTRAELLNKSAGVVAATVALTPGPCNGGEDRRRVGVVMDHRPRPSLWLRHYHAASESPDCVVWSAACSGVAGYKRCVAVACGG